MIDDRAEREQLAARMRSMNGAFESTALPSLVNPLLSLDLTIQQLKVMTVLVSTEDGATGRGLSETFGVSMASMSGVLDRLEAQGMAVRSLDTHDSRVRRIHATQHGRDAMRRLVALRPEFGDDVLRSLPIDDLRALVQGMAAVHTELERRRVALGLAPGDGDG